MIVELTGGPLDGMELDVPTPLPGHMMVPVLPDQLAEWIDDPSVRDTMHIPVPVYYAYRRGRDLFITGRMIRYTYEGY